MSFAIKTFLCATTSFLLFFSFPKADAWFLAWAAYVPLLIVLLNEKNPKKAFAQGFFSHTLFYIFLMRWVPAIQRIGNIGIPALFLLSAVSALYPSVFCVVFFYMKEKLFSQKTSFLKLLHLALFSSFLFVVCDYVRSLGFFGFTWGSLGYTQYKNLPVIQIAEWTGYHGVTFLVILVNVCLVMLPQSITVLSNPHERKIFARFCVVTILVIVAIYLHAAFRVINTKLLPPGKKVAIIQGNTVRDTNWTPAYRESVFGVYEKLSKQAMTRKPELLVYPERVIAYGDLNEPYYVFRLANIAKSLNVVLATGVSDSIGKDKFYNTAAVFSREGRLLGKFYKTKLVPFGEKVPFKNLFLRFGYNPWGNWLDDSAGETFNPIDTPVGKIGFNICYETTYAHVSRLLVKNGAEILVGVIADSWYKEVETYQHTAMFVFRAVENRRYAIRTADSGISAIITLKGEILNATKPFTQAIVHGTVQPLTALTFYTRHGDVFAWFCVVYCMISLFFLFRGKKTGAS